MADEGGVVREVILNGPGGEAIFMFEGEV
jgi:hypothetical protein